MIRYSATINGKVWRINVVHVYPPIPVRDQDWFAGFDDDEGYGEHAATPEDAIEALICDKMSMDDYCLPCDKPE